MGISPLKKVCEFSDFSSEVIVVSVCLAMGTQTVDSKHIAYKSRVTRCRIPDEVSVDDVQSYVHTKCDRRTNSGRHFARVTEINKVMHNICGSQYLTLLITLLVPKVASEFLEIFSTLAFYYCYYYYYYYYYYY